MLAKYVPNSSISLSCSTCHLLFPPIFRLYLLLSFIFLFFPLVGFLFDSWLVAKRICLCCLEAGRRDSISSEGQEGHSHNACTHITEKHQSTKTLVFAALLLLYYYCYTILVLRRPDSHSDTSSHDDNTNLIENILFALCWFSLKQTCRKLIFFLN